MIIPNAMLPHIAKIFNGEYEIPVNSEEGFRILDIGANIGGFAVWASNRWPGSKIICFEPIKENFELLTENTKDLQAEVLVRNKAVRHGNGTAKMYLGKNNQGEASFNFGPEQSENTEEVEYICSSMLPKADLVKIDTEGSEVEIVSNLVNKPYILLIEFHSANDRVALDKLLNSEYFLFECKLTTLHCGILKYISKEFIRKSS